MGLTTRRVVRAERLLALALLALSCINCDESAMVGYGADYGTYTPSTDAGVASDTATAMVPFIEDAAFITLGGDFLSSWAHLFGRWQNDDGQELHLVSGIRIANPSSAAVTAFVQVDMPGFARPATRQVVLPAGGPVDVDPMTPYFDYDALYDVVSSVTAEISVELSVGNERVDFRSESVSVEPVGRVRWQYHENGERYDMRPFVVTLVTPDDRDGAIQRLIREAAPYTSSGAMVGYQPGTLETSYEQAEAVYLALQNAYRMVYTNVPGSFFDGAQRVRLPSESLETQSANCIDGALVFASAFEALGMEPVLVFMSGHALVALKSEPGAGLEQWIPIETTMLGSSTFAEAVQEGIARANAAMSSDPEFLAVDVVARRRAGFAPINQ